MIGRRRERQVYTTVVRADDRFVTEQEGITSKHCFSAGAHFDPDNTAFGALVGVDDHLLAAGAGFGEHPHRRVAIITWVVEGALRHTDDTGATQLVEPGRFAVQVGGRGVRHTERNDSATEPARFVQTTLVCDDDEPSYRPADAPVVVANSLVTVHRTGRLIVEAERTHLFVIDGEFRVGRDGLYPGDSMRATTEPITVEGDGEMLVVLLR